MFSRLKSYTDCYSNKKASLQRLNSLFMLQAAFHFLFQKFFAEVAVALVFVVACCFHLPLGVLGDSDFLLIVGFPPVSVVFPGRQVLWVWLDSFAGQHFEQAVAVYFVREDCFDAHQIVVA